jgi:hypothetical protein
MWLSPFDLHSSHYKFIRSLISTGIDKDNTCSRLQNEISPNANTMGAELSWSNLRAQGPALPVAASMRFFNPLIVASELDNLLQSVCVIDNYSSHPFMLLLVLVRKLK